MNICSLLPLVRVGSPVQATTYATYPSAGNGAVKFSCPSATPSGAGGLIGGKLFLVEGYGSPRSPVSNVSATVTNTPSATLTNRITCAAGTFTGVGAGNWIRLTNSNNGAPLLDYQIWSTDSSTYIDVFGGTSGKIIPLGAATLSMSFYRGLSGIDASMNGQTAPARAFFEADIGYPLEMMTSESGYVYGALSGWVSSALNPSACDLWEVVVGDDGFGSPHACDGWRKTNSLRWHQIYRTDENAVSRVRDGSAMACRVIKGNAGTERLWINLAQRNPSDEKLANGNDPLKIFQLQGKVVTFGMEWWSPSASTARPFIFDGTNYTYGTYFASGSYDWQEVTLALPSNATQAMVGIEITGSIGDVHYGTQPIAAQNLSSIGRGNYVPYEGLIALAHHQHFRRYVNSTPLPQYQKIRTLQESNGQIRSPKGLTLDLEGRSRWTSSMFLANGADLSQPSCVLIDNKPTSIINLSSGATALYDGETKYLGLGALSTTEANNIIPIPFAATIRGMVVTKSAGGSGTLYATLRVNGVDTGMTFYFSTVTQGSYIPIAPNANLLVSVNPSDKVSLKVHGGGGMTTATIQASLLITPSDPPLHIPCIGMQTIGRNLVAAPTPCYADELFMQSNTNSGGWYEVTIDILGAAV